MKRIEIKELDRNIVSLLSENWMLISAGNKETFNSMTASWGGLGFIWNKPIAISMIRPQRHTYNFTEKCECFTLSFYDEKYKDALKIFGSLSGRDVNKVEKTKFTPAFTPDGNPTYEEAFLTLECKKTYADFLNADSFIDKSLCDTWYPAKDFHKIYFGEIMNVFVK